MQALLETRVVNYKCISQEGNIYMQKTWSRMICSKDVHISASTNLVSLLSCFMFWFQQMIYTSCSNIEWNWCSDVYNMCTFLNESHRSYNDDWSIWTRVNKDQVYLSSHIHIHLFLSVLPPMTWLFPYRAFCVPCVCSRSGQLRRYRCTLT